MWRTILLLSLAWTADAQTLTFDVASVKVNRTGTYDNSTLNTHPASIEGTNDSLSLWIRYAYNLQPTELSGPNWIDNDRFDIMAKASREVNKDELRQMLQALLVDRFKLEFHREEKQLRNFLLVVDKGGLKIQPVEGDQKNMHGSRNSLEATQAPLSQLAGNLVYFLNSPVSDETKTPGNFTYTLKWGPDNVSPPGPTIFEALREQLGLRLDERKTATQVMVIDHVERVPTGN